MEYSERTATNEIQVPGNIQRQVGQMKYHVRDNNTILGYTFTLRMCQHEQRNSGKKTLIYRCDGTTGVYV